MQHGIIYRNKFFPDEDFWAIMENRIQEKGQSISHIELILLYRRRRTEEKVEIGTPLKWTYGQQVGGAMDNVSPHFDVGL